LLTDKSEREGQQDAISVEASRGVPAPADVFRTLSYTWHAFLGFAQAERGPQALLKRKQKQSSTQAAQAQHYGTEENSPVPKRVRVVREGQAVLALPRYKGEGREQSNVDGEEEEKRGIEDAVRQVLRIPQDSPVTYKSSEQKAALYAVVRGFSPLIVILPTGGGKTLLPVAAAVLDNATQQESDRPSVTILVLPFRALTTMPRRIMHDPRQNRYRAWRRNAHNGKTRGRTTKTAPQLEAIEPHTIAIIAFCFGGEIYGTKIMYCAIKIALEYELAGHIVTE
jgi:hypothetical protein